jgi:uncharacterized metal-binding protein YceD (DUF177 family)
MDQPVTLPFRPGALSSRKPQRFDLRPEPAALAALADLLGITAVRKMHFVGEIRASGRGDFVLEGTLTAQVVQPCGITLAPVVTNIHEPVLRRFVADMPVPEGDEVELPEDDSAEPLPEIIDAGAVAAEALALALPLYPRAPGAELPGAVVVGPPGVAPLKDEDLRPFAGLAALAAKTAASPGPDEDKG